MKHRLATNSHGKELFHPSNIHTNGTEAAQIDVNNDCYDVGVVNDSMRYSGIIGGICIEVGVAGSMITGQNLCCIRVRSGNSYQRRVSKKQVKIKSGAAGKITQKT
eukprot:scaffold249321_cov71-Cyclotella_meneghiniana.AAC.1